MGLLRLPEEWVPPFLVLTSEFRGLVTRVGGVAQAFDRLPESDRQLLDAFLSSEVSEGRSAAVFVRSNSAREDMNARGAYRSVAARPNLDAVLCAVGDVLHAGDDEMCPIIQRAIEPGQQGHMSNERRISPTVARWLVEGLGPPEETFGRMIIAGRVDRPEAPLRADSHRAVLARLREVAGFLSRLPPKRYHCEWVWNASRLWLVQCDRADPDERPGEADGYLRASVSSPPSFTSPALLRHFSSEPDRWRKLQRPRLFRSLGLPVADVYVLTGSEWEADRSSGAGRLYSDLAGMCSAGEVVIRCDVSNASPATDVLLPTSAATREPGQLLHFVSEVARHFEEKHVPIGEWAILPAFLYPARASAMVHARPKAERVRIDALWGFPDGLSYFPHDTWFYYPGERRTASHLRYKNTCLLPEGSTWLPRSVGAPFDWDSVLSDDEAACLGAWALRVADELNAEVQFMALARIGGTRGPNGCLPWHYTQWLVPSYSASLRMLPPAGVVDTVRSTADLAALRSQSPSYEPRGLYLRPDPPLLRDDGFLRETARLAADTKRVVYFEGSVLGHAYYILSREGATVVPLNEVEPVEDEKKYDKLVRDNIPLIIRQAGGLARVRQIGRAEARGLLRQKLVEEAFEALNANDQTLVEELADVLDVVDALARSSGIDSAYLASVRQAKRAKRGGFDKGIYLESTAIRPLRFPGDDQGVLPLLDLDDSAPPVQRRSDVSNATIRELPPQRGERARFRVSLIPPATEEPVARFASQTLAGVVTIRYAGSTVDISIADPPQPPNTKQLTLFPSSDSAQGVVGDAETARK